MKVALTRKVKSPERGTELSAGIDFFVPEFDDSFVKKFEKLNNRLGAPRIKSRGFFNLIPHQRVLIPSGIKVDFSGEPCALIAFNKSGVASSKGLDIMACVVDQDYTGEVFISLNNTSDDLVKIKENDKIAQFILVPVLYENIEVVGEEETHQEGTDRGEGNLGSTD